jgi:hypothetical protein
MRGFMICATNQMYYSGDIIRRSEMGGACITDRRDDITCPFLCLLSFRSFSYFCHCITI